MPSWLEICTYVQLQRGSSHWKSKHISAKSGYVSVPCMFLQTTCSSHPGCFVIVVLLQPSLHLGQITTHDVVHVAPLDSDKGILLGGEQRRMIYGHYSLCGAAIYKCMELKSHSVVLSVHICWNLHMVWSFLEGYFGSVRVTPFFSATCKAHSLHDLTGSSAINRKLFRARARGPGWNEVETPSFGTGTRVFGSLEAGRAVMGLPWSAVQWGEEAKKVVLPSGLLPVLKFALG